MNFDLPFFHSPWFVPAILWTLIWKGIALYRAGTLRDKWWFVALLIVNTFGVLEIVYLLVWSKRERGDAGTANLPPHGQ
jgi:hypothetical protein